MRAAIATLTQTRATTEPRAIRIALPVLHADQRAVAEQMRGARFALLRAGRRWGKSRLLSTLMLRAALRGKSVAYFAPTYKLMLPAWETVARTLPPPVFTVSKSERRVDGPGGGRIEFWSLDRADAGRSRGYDLAVIDEAGLIHDLATIWRAAIAPTLLDRRGRAIIAGTPKGKNGFWMLHQEALAHPDRWMTIHRRTTDNPLLDPSDVALLRRAMTERAARQELDAEFLEDGGAVFRKIRECVGNPQRSGQPAVIGVDWGRYEDATVFVALDSQTKCVVDVERLTDTEFATQRRILTAFWQRNGCGAIIAEANSIGTPNIEELRRSGLPVQAFDMENASKSLIIDALALAFEQKQITIPAVEWLLSELETFTVEVLPSGRSRYSAPEGLHDDGVIALALAWYGTQNVAQAERNENLWRRSYR